MSDSSDETTKLWLDVESDVMAWETAVDSIATMKRRLAALMPEANKLSWEGTAVGPAIFWLRSSIHVLSQAIHQLCLVGKRHHLQVKPELQIRG